MALIGVDVGNYNTKTSEGIIFPSRITTKERILNDSRILIYDDKTYLITGELEINLNKSQKQNILPLLFTAILESTNDIQNDIVIGLPIGQFKQNKDYLKKLIPTDQLITLDYCNKRQNLFIDRLEVFPEGLGAYLSLDERPKNCIIVDIGGRTTNIVEIKDRKHFSSLTKAIGMLNLYSSMSNTINSKYCLKLRPEDMEDVFYNGLCIDGKKVELEFDGLKDIVDDLMGELDLNFSARTKEILLTGGGSVAFYNTFKKKLPNTRLINDLFANANGFKKVGESLWNAAG